MSQKTIVCSVCGKEFIASNKRGPNPTVCSEQCRTKRDQNLKERRYKNKLICAYCGKEIKNIKNGNVLYCSADCYHKARRTLKGTEIRCLTCGKKFEPQTKEQKYCSVECCSSHRRIYPCINYCKECGKQYIQISGNKGFCSAKCAAHYNSRELREKNKICFYCGKTFNGKGKYCSEECEFKQQIKNKTKVCEYCGKTFIRSGSENYCSDECRKASVRIKFFEYAKTKHIPKKIKCKKCGKYFTTEYGDKRKEFCSDKCLKQYNSKKAKAARRARIRGNGYELFDPHEVLRRDNYTCQICGVKTPIELRGTYDDCAPELDHVIPIALGGEHTRENTQCLCRKCNQTKGATIQCQA